MSEALQLFIVGTGRSGTQTLAHLLSSVDGVVVEHEHEPLLLAEIKDYAEGRRGREEVVSLLAATRSPGEIGGRLVSGESHNQLSFALPLLAEAFPGARIIWLVRDGRAVVASMVERKIYHPRELDLRAPGTEEWARNRLQGDAVGDVSPERWRALDAFGRCCWYWSYTHRVIARDMDRLELPLLRLRLEDLGNSWPALAEFCDLPPAPAPAIPHSNRSRRSPISWRHWSKEQQGVFQELCGPVMDENYPGWAQDQPRGLGSGVTSLMVRGRAGLRSSVADLLAPVRVKRRRRARREASSRRG
jgi:hypothetical protein